MPTVKERVSQPTVPGHPPSRTRDTTNTVLLACGVASSLLYVISADVVSATIYDGYSRTSQAVSELFAFGAPSRPVFIALGLVYGVLVIMFGLGVWQAAHGNRAIRVTGGLLVAYAVAGFSGPFFSMTGRGEVEGSIPFNDLMHIIITGLLVLIMFIAIAFALTALGKRFRLYSVVTLVALVVGGALAGVQAPQLAAGEPTPWLGVLERVNIGAFLLWVAVLALTLLRRRKVAP